MTLSSQCERPSLSQISDIILESESPITKRPSTHLNSNLDSDLGAQKAQDSGGDQAWF